MIIFGDLCDMDLVWDFTFVKWRMGFWLIMCWLLNDPQWETVTCQFRQQCKLCCYLSGLSHKSNLHKKIIYFITLIHNLTLYSPPFKNKIKTLYSPYLILLKRLSRSNLWTIVLILLKRLSRSNLWTIVQKKKKKT